MFDWKRLTTEMLGRFKPWHAGHTELFRRALAETGQVAIMIRDVGGVVGEPEGSQKLADRALSLADKFGFIQPGAGYPVQFKFR